LNDLYDLLRYLIVLRATGNDKRLDAIECYFRGHSPKECSIRTGVERTALKAMIVRVCHMGRGYNLYRLVPLLVNVIKRTIPVVVEDYVGKQYCRLCGRMMRLDMGNWVQHFEWSHRRWLIEQIERIEYIVGGFERYRINGYVYA